METFRVPSEIKELPANELASDPRVAEFYARTYDDSVPDWPGEIDFYRGLASEVKVKGGSLLEVACGTGRVTIRLAQDGPYTVGLDLSEKMLEVAREKGKAIPNLKWVEADMRDFELGETFDLVLIPGHAFQNSQHDARSGRMHAVHLPSRQTGRAARGPP